MLAVDEALASLTLPHWVHLEPHLIASYLAAGAALGIACEFALGMRRPASRTFASVFAWTFAILYAGPIAERVFGTLLFRRIIPVPVCALAAVVAVGAYGAGIFVLRLLSGGRPAWVAPVIGGLVAATGLALNRNVFWSSTAPAALAVDAALVAAGAAAALLARAPRGIARGAVAAAAVGVVALFFLRWSPPLEAQTRGPVPSPRPPDLLLILIDTLRQDVFRDVADHTEEGRRFREALRGSVWFNRTMAAAPWTGASMASIMTGLYPQEHGFDSVDPTRGLTTTIMTTLPESVTTLAQRLHDSGFVTLGIVTNYAVAPVTGMARGFQRYDVLRGPTTKLPLLSFLVWSGVLSTETYASAEDVRRAFARSLEAELPEGAPVFRYVHLLDPHDPLHPHDDLSEDPAGEELPPTDRLYRDETRYALREVAGMLEALRATGRFDDTLVVFLSDHGEMLPSDGQEMKVEDGDGHPKVYGHGSGLYDSLINVPLVIRPPGGVGADREVDALTSHVDVHDTVLDALGIDAPRIGRDRVSLAPWLGPEAPRRAPRTRDHTLSRSVSAGPDQRSLRLEGLKLIDYPNGEFADELYDLERDPGERSSVADRRPDLLDEARQRLEGHWSALAPSPETEPAPLTQEMRKQLEALGYIDEDR